MVEPAVVPILEHRDEDHVAVSSAVERLQRDHLDVAAGHGLVPWDVEDWKGEEFFARGAIRKREDALRPPSPDERAPPREGKGGLDQKKNGDPWLGKRPVRQDRNPRQRREDQERDPHHGQRQGLPHGSPLSTASLGSSFRSSEETKYLARSMRRISFFALARA